jgi:hypothetical protein
MPVLEYYLERIPSGLPPHLHEEKVKEAKRKAIEDVFGVGYQVDKHGRPIERGIGASGNESEQHYAAIEKYEGKEAADRARAAAAARKAR